MSAFSIVFDAVAHLANGSTGLVLIAKWTLLLALAWLAHAALAGRNPRWRVALWRGAMLGVATIAVLATAPPIVSVPIVPDGPRRIVERAEQPGSALRVEPAPPAVIVSPPESPSTVRGVAIAADVPAEPVPSPPAESWPSRAIGLARSWAPTVWLAGLIILTARLILASLALDRLVRRSADAPEDIARECRTIAERLGCTRTVRVVRSPEVATPCLAGIVRPVLLLPDREGQDDLPAILAHELAHARHHDLSWNLAAHLASIALWFHPLAWRIRSAHAAACDAVSDAVAADYLGDVASYGRTLARMAVEASSPAPAHVLAMARTSEVWRRLDALNRHVFRTPLSWRRVMPALFVGALILVLIGGFGVSRAGQDAAKPAPKAAEPAPQPVAPSKESRIVLRTVEAATGEPIDGVSIKSSGRFDGNLRQEIVTTDEDGTAAISWAHGVRIDQLWITARRPKYVPVFILWDGERRPIRLPASKELRLEPGTTMGGIVKDEAGQPVPGATVEVNGPPTESELPNYAFSIGTARTDEQGQWRLDVAPRDLAGISASVTHPRYRRSWAAISHDLHSVTILKKGLTITGQVVDADGRPIKGAGAVMGRDVWGSKNPTATTDERGAFSLENCPAGGTIVTVQANGFGPRIHDVTVDERTPPVVIRMTEPGATVRGRVVDIAGKPVAGAFFAADTWRGNRSIQFRVNTDKDGRFEWRNAPRDVVLYDIGKDGYMASRDVPLTASDREQTVILYPKLVISGRVTDAVTGHPVPKFRVVQGRPIVGQNEINWSEPNGVDESGGRFTSQFDEPSDKLFVRVEAPGYRTADSRAFRPNEGRQTFDFVLQPTAALSGIVELPDGTPAAGADVALATLGHHVSLQSGRFERDANAPRFTTAADGRFAFAAPEGKFLLIALSDAGFAEASSDEVAKSSKLVLQPWGRIEGGVRIGARAGADQEVAFLPTRPNRGGFFVFSYGYITRSDLRGRFAFDRVLPGPGTMSRVVISDLVGGSQMHSPCWPEPVEVKPGQAVEVKVGGKGRPVIGRLVLDGTPEIPVELDAERAGGVADPPRKIGETPSPRVSGRRQYRPGRPVPHRGRPRGPVRAAGPRQRGPGPRPSRRGEHHRQGDDDRHRARDPRRPVEPAARPGHDHRQAGCDPQGRRPRAGLHGPADRRQ